MLFKGVATALITPFAQDKVDFKSLERLVDLQLAGKIDALVVNGTTGEPTTMTHAERTAVAECVISRVAKRVPVVCGAGSNNTYTAIEYAQEAEALGADGVLTVTPYYNKCTQNGLIAHYSAVADSVKIPLIMYNVPSRTGVNMLPATVAKLAAHKNIAAVKEASGNIEQVMDIVRLTGGKFAVFSGDDNMTLPLLAAGGCGVISVASNILAKFVTDSVRAYFEGDIEKCRNMQYKLFPLTKMLFSEVNPIPVKTAAAMLGIIASPYMRLPLTPMENVDGMRAELEKFGLKCE